MNLETYWRIGERIVVEEQKCEKKAEYGEYLTVQSNAQSETAFSPPKNKSEALSKAGLLDKQSPADFIKDPYIFEFLNIPETQSSSEQEIEAALIENLKDFLLELGKGFCFVKRQLCSTTCNAATPATRLSAWYFAQ